MAGLYVHIPFCHAKCAYCDFYSIALRAKADAFAEAAVAEYRSRLPELGGRPVETVYLGGGTPSCLPAAALEKLVAAIDTSATSEFTIEVNPEDVNASSAALWRSLGINRVSMGIQSLDDGELREIRRRHSAAEALAAVDTLHAAGFDNISCDLIYGLPGQTPESFARSLDMLLEKDIQHLSAYLLSFEPHTLLTRRLDRGEIAEMDFENVYRCYEILCRTAAARGFGHYEISNFAKPGRRSLHNSNYWNLTPYLGIGPAAHSLRADGVRVFHNPDLNSWLKEPAQVEFDEENRLNLLNDMIIISLRTARGLPREHFSAHEWRQITTAAAPFLADGTLVEENGHLRIPEKDWLQSDAVMRELLFI